MPRSNYRVSFAHGMESAPWGVKIRALAEVAEAMNWSVESPDYRFTTDPDERLEHLRSHRPDADRLVLVGSSMGGYVAAHAAAELDAAGLLLLAPALFMPGYDQPPPAPACPTVVAHGWCDDVIPIEHAYRYARDHRAEFMALADGHTLTRSLPALRDGLVRLLRTVESTPAAARPIAAPHP